MTDYHPAPELPAPDSAFRYIVVLVGAGLGLVVLSLLKVFERYFPSEHGTSGND